VRWPNLPQPSRCSFVFLENVMPDLYPGILRPKHAAASQLVRRELKARKIRVHVASAGNVVLMTQGRYTFPILHVAYISSFFQTLGSHFWQVSCLFESTRLHLLLSHQAGLSVSPGTCRLSRHLQPPFYIHLSSPILYTSPLHYNIGIPFAATASPYGAANNYSLLGRFLPP
jgi:hypothetical protein